MNARSTSQHHAKGTNKIEFDLKTPTQDHHIGDYNGLIHAGNLVVPVYMATGSTFPGLAPRPTDEEVVCNRITP